MFYKKGQLYKIETDGELEGSMTGRYIGIHGGKKVFSGKVKVMYEKKITERNIYIFLKEHESNLTDVEVIGKKEFDKKANAKIKMLEDKINGVKQ